MQATVNIENEDNKDTNERENYARLLEGRKEKRRGGVDRQLKKN